MSKSPLFNKLYPVMLLVIAVLFCYVYTNLSKPKLGYVVIEEVFNDFKLKKELQKKLESVKNARQKIVDSLRIDLTILSKKIQTNIASKEEKDLFDRKRLEYNQRTQIFEEDNAALTKQYDQEIIAQLNQYIKDYGEKNKFDMIYGNADGSLMYGKTDFNITKEVAAFINQKYDGIK